MPFLRSALLSLVLVFSQNCLAEFHVLVIGIDEYKEPGHNLAGCINDRDSFVSLLQTKFAVPETAITKLGNAEATKEGIVKGMEEKLVAKAKPEDTVILYYAGHGDFTQDFDGDEDDQMDESLIPHDGSPTDPGTWITDDELALLFSKLQTKRAWLVFDSCHSGTISRTAAGLAETRSAGLGNKRASTTPDGQPIKVDKFSASMRSAFPHFVIMSACDASEEANEIRGREWDTIGMPGHKDGGLFTTALVKVLEQSPDIKVDTIMEQVGDISGQWIKKLSKKAQTPQWEGPDGNTPLTGYVQGSTEITVAENPPQPPSSNTPPPQELTMTSDGVVTTGSIKLTIKTNGRVFQEGDQLHLEVQADLDCFLRVYYLSAENKTYQIFPNQFQRENEIKKDTPVKIPGPDAKFALKMSPPFGNEVLKVVASSVQFTDLEDDAWAQQLFQSYSQTDLQSMSVRGINPTKTSRQFGEAVLIYRVGEKSPPANP